MAYLFGKHKLGRLVTERDDLYITWLWSNYTVVPNSFLTVFPDTAISMVLLIIKIKCFNVVNAWRCVNKSVKPLFIFLSPVHECPNAEQSVHCNVKFGTFLPYLSTKDSIEINAHDKYNRQRVYRCA